MQPISFIGIDQLENSEASAVTEISQEQFLKLQREIHNLTSLVVHIKVHSKSETGAKHSAHLRGTVATKVFTASHHDSRPQDAVRQGLRKLEKEIKHKFRKG